MSLRGHLIWIVAVAVVSAVALPVLVFHTGQAMLGPYAGGGLREFVTDYLADLARFRPGARTLLLGPVALVAAWRLLVAIGWPRREATVPAGASDSHRGSATARRDPTIGGFSPE